MRAVDLHSRRLVQEHGFTGPQLATLQKAARLGPVSVGALAHAVHLSHPTVTGILDRLASRGLVQRTRDGDDRRSVMVTVTPGGKEAVAAAPSLLQDRVRRELAKLDDWERTMMLANLQRIATMMDAEALQASPLLVSGPVAGSEQEAGDNSTRSKPDSEVPEAAGAADLEPGN